MKTKSEGKPPMALHRRIYAELRKEIAAHYKAGDVLPSQNVLARRFGVSFLTVREALSALAEDGIIRRIRGHDTIVIDPTAHQHIAVLLEQDIAHPRISYFFRRLPYALRNWFQQRGHRVRFYSGAASPVEDNVELFKKAPSSCPEFLNDMEADTLRGVAIVGGATLELRRHLEQRQVPIVGQDPSLRHYVNVDLNVLIREGLRFLWEQGRRNIAVMSWGDPGRILKEARDLGYDIRIDRIRCDIPPATPDAGYREFLDLWTGSRDRPDGLLITDGELFSDALHGMIEQHVKVPEELAVISHDTIGSPFWAPFPVARLLADADAVANEMGRLMMALIENPDLPPRGISLPPQLSLP